MSTRRKKTTQPNPRGSKAAHPAPDAFDERLARHHDELRWLYMELYGNGDMFAELIHTMRYYYDERPKALRALDAKREAEGAWYRDQKMLGMQMYIDNFAGTIKGVEERLPYLERCNVTCIHLMPFLDTPLDKSRSDGGYAVSDFRRVRPDLGTMDDLAHLAATCHEHGISLCMDFVMNHTSGDHEWARRARAGEGEYMSRYFFEANPAVIERYSRDVPQVFPTTAPGHFTYLPELGQSVMTQFYPYQWDLNYRNPRVFNEMMYNFLFLANQGMDIIRLDAVPYIWKELGTNCRNLPQVHTIVRMMRMIGEVVCPGIALLGEVVMAPVEVVPYFGTPEKPECHMLYNVTTMATTWHTVATRDTRPAAQPARRRVLAARLVHLPQLPALPRRHRLGASTIRSSCPGASARWSTSASSTTTSWGGRRAARAAARSTTPIPSRATRASAARRPRCAVSRRRASRATRRRWTSPSRRTSCSTPTCSPSPASPSSTAAMRSPR